MDCQTVLAGIGGPLALIYVVNWFLSSKKRTDLKGKVVLITGANSGLGKACAHAFYQQGCSIILAGRNLEQLQEVQTDLQRLYPSMKGNLAMLKLDLGDVDQLTGKVQEAVGMMGHVDILINNAGISFRGSVEDTDLDVHIKLMTVNYFGQIALTKAVLPHMLERGGGHIVAISTLQGRFSQPYRSAYAASKHALQAYCDSLRAEMADQNIHVCVVNPGYIRTNLSQNALCGDGSKYGVLDKTTASGHPPEYVAGLIVNAVQNHKTELTPARFHHRLVIIIRAVWPTLYFWIMAHRARKQRLEYVKNS